MQVIDGNATWYCLCPGGSCPSGRSGACGCNGQALHIAWPNETTTNCNDQCGTNPALPCNRSIYVYDYCTSTGNWGCIRDCCPCRSQEGCSLAPGCCSGSGYECNWVTPLLDLTEAFFINIQGSLTVGRIAVEVTIPDEVYSC